MILKPRLKNFFTFCKRSYSSVCEGIVVTRRNDKAIIQFDRPKKLNAMSNEMQVNLAIHLRDFECDPGVSAVIIKGNEIGFSAGGDIVQFAKLLETDASRQHFFDCGTIFHRGLLRLAEFKKPVISLADKICMGGGAAVTFLSSHPVITERTVFAMPEVFIGFYPNVGANYFLVQLPNLVGLFLGLTGKRLIGSDIINLGLTKNYVNSGDIQRLEDALINLESANYESVSNTIAKFQQEHDVNKWNIDPIDPNKVEQLFSGSSVEQIIENFKNDNSKFSTEILQLFSTLSPTSLKFTFNLFRESRLKKYNKNDAISADFSLFRNYYGANLNDFREGIYSVLIDKKHKPNWIPKTLQEVDDKEVISYFTNNVIDIRSSDPS